MNQQQLISAPALIEALYKNRNTRMSTADRLIELARTPRRRTYGDPQLQRARGRREGAADRRTNRGAPSCRRPLCRGAREDADREAIVQDEEEGTEEVEEEFVPLLAKIQRMTMGEKLRLAMLGNAAARSILIRDPNKLVSKATIAAPAVNENEAKNIAHSREVHEDVLRYIAKKKESGQKL